MVKVRIGEEMLILDLYIGETSPWSILITQRSRWTFNTTNVSLQSIGSIKGSLQGEVESATFILFLFPFRLKRTIVVTPLTCI